MLSLIQSIKVIPKFVAGILSFRRREYQLTFVRDGVVWYIDMPWPGDRANLAMVSGSDKMLSFLDTENMDRVRLSVMPSSHCMKQEGYFECERTWSSVFGGATYMVHGLQGFEREIWICPVTLTVLGHYPKFIYLRKLEE